MKSIAIKENHLYKKTYLGGQKAGGRFTSVYILKDKKAYLLKKQHPLKITVNRIGLAVNKRVGCAVQRNRAKRVIRAALAEIEKQLGLKKGYLVVIKAKDDAANVKSTEIFEEMKRQFSKLGMLVCEPADVK